MSWKLSFLIFVAGLLVLVKPAYANSGVSIDQDINVTIFPDRSASFNTVLNIQNNSNSVLSEMNLSMLTAMLPNIELAQDGTKLSSYDLNTDQLKFKLIRPLLAGSRSTISVSYAIDNALTNSAGAWTLYLPKLAQIENTVGTIKWKLTSSVGVPALAYASKNNINNFGNRLEWQGEQDTFLIFSDPATQLDVHLNLDIKTEQKVVSQIYNYPYKDDTTNIDYIYLPGTPSFYSLSTGNYFQEIDLESKTAEFIWQYNGNDITLDKFKFFPSRTMAWDTVQVASSDLPNRAYELVLSRLRPAKLNHQRSPSSIGNAGLTFADEERTFNSLEYAQLLTDYLNYANIPARVVYGYLRGFDQYPATQFSGPVAWVETWQSGKIIAYNPYLEDLTGLIGRQIPNSLGIRLGIYNINNTYDSALGLIGDSLIAQRPRIVVSQENGNFNHSENINVNISVLTPVQNALGWSTYRPELTLSNHGRKPVAVTSIKIDAVEDVNNLVVSNDLYPLILGGRNIVLNPLVWAPNLFGGDSRHEGQVTVISASTTQIVEFNYQLPVLTNIPVALGIIIVIILSLIAWLLVIRKFRHLH